MAAAVGLVLAAGLSGCAGPAEPTVALDPAAQDVPEPRLPPEPRPPRDADPATPPTPEQAELARDFLAFAGRPGARSAAALPWAPRVWLGLGENLFTAERRALVSDPSTWDLDVDAYGAVGPMSALRTVRPVVRREGTDALRTSVGPHPQCVGRPSRAPAYFSDAERISLQPARTDSCLEWFAVDLYVDERGLVVGVTLELWEP